MLYIETLYARALIYFILSHLNRIKNDKKLLLKK